MEFDFNINLIFYDVISVVSGDIVFSNRHDKLQIQRDLENVIDEIGRKSAQAQHLSAPITTWSKLRINRHKVYLLKDPDVNNGKGKVVGFIKIGKKQLFVLYRDGKHNEFHPLCVLDFYVHESQQRKGHGLKLFKYMLQTESVEPSHLAIDKPSTKFISFLRKHFNLWVNVFHRRNYSCNDSLNGIRPMSGSTLNGSGDRPNFQNSGQGARANMFSRFAMDENSYVPSPPQNRRRSLRSQQNDEIITNPYRRITNTASRNRELINEEPMKSKEHVTETSPFQELQNGTKSEIKNQISVEPDKQQEISQVCNKDEKTQSNITSMRKDLFQAKSGYNSLRNPLYSKPSDMILELKRKDKQDSQNNSNRAVQDQRSSLFGSSWNVFGVPTPLRQKWNNQHQ
uniref:LOW QUALITY PROTEIN: alpha-tubulin N-acetyltransferase-like n=1 Tax=Styela clava TaxID=7725 RepID=UPI0019395CC9|nr:LOW QUALITY PROTEIN: alpha-tubulin N-acetyltransferase-like [Styela clava]